jgi:hypothetical protein
MATRQVKPKSPANLFVPVELATLEPVKGLVLTYRKRTANDVLMNQ